MRKYPERAKAYGKKYRTENKEKLARKGQAWHLKSTFGLSLDDYDCMVTAQDGKCAICGEQNARLCVDHDHETGKIRGLLCRQCNAALGIFYDDPAILQQAIEYLGKEETMSEWKGKYRLSSLWYWAWSANPEVFIGIRFVQTAHLNFLMFGFLIGAWVLQRRRKNV